MVLGPDDEVETVRRVFRLFALTGLRRHKIAELLNAEGQLNSVGGPWSPQAISRMLRNEAYVGTYVFNRRRVYLKGPREWNPPEAIIRVPGAIPAIVSKARFDHAQVHMDGVHQRLTDEEMLARLKQLLRTRGRLSRALMHEAHGVPSYHTYQTRFGSLENAYHLVGYVPAGRQAHALARRQAPPSWPAGLN